MVLRWIQISRKTGGFDNEFQCSVKPEHRPVKDQKEKSREKNGRASLRSLKTPKLNPDTCSKSWTRYGIVPTAKRLGMTLGRDQTERILEEDRASTKKKKRSVDAVSREARRVFEAHNNNLNADHISLRRL